MNPTPVTRGGLHLLMQMIHQAGGGTTSRICHGKRGPAARIGNGSRTAGSMWRVPCFRGWRQGPGCFLLLRQKHEAAGSEHHAFAVRAYASLSLDHSRDSM